MQQFDEPHSYKTLIFDEPPTYKLFPFRKSLFRTLIFSSKKLGAYKTLQNRL